MLRPPSQFSCHTKRTQLVRPYFAPTQGCAVLELLWSFLVGPSAVRNISKHCNMCWTCGHLWPLWRPWNSVKWSQERLVQRFQRKLKQSTRALAGLLVPQYLSNRTWHKYPYIIQPLCKPTAAIFNLFNIPLAGKTQDDWCQTWNLGVCIQTTSCHFGTNAPSMLGSVAMFNILRRPNGLGKHKMTPWPRPSWMPAILSMPLNAAMLPRAMWGFAFLHAKVRFLGKKWHVTARPKSRAMQETSKKLHATTVSINSPAIK